MGRFTLERWLLVATFVTSVAAFVFGAGVQWAKTTAVDARVDATNEQIAAIQVEYVRRDVYTAEQVRLSEAIDRLSRAVERIVERDVATRTRPSTEGAREPIPFRSGAR